jgi:hypothetical protein
VDASAAHAFDAFFHCERKKKVLGRFEQGCQIFLGTYMTPKPERMYQIHTK